MKSSKQKWNRRIFLRGAGLAALGSMLPPLEILGGETRIVAGKASAQSTSIPKTSFICSLGEWNADVALAPYRHHEPFESGARRSRDLAVGCLRLIWSIE